jgi:hypothetical protein
MAFGEPKAVQTVELGRRHKYGRFPHSQQGAVKRGEERKKGGMGGNKFSFPPMRTPFLRFFDSFLQKRTRS